MWWWPRTHQRIVPPPTDEEVNMKRKLMYCLFAALSWIVLVAYPVWAGGAGKKN